MCVNNTLDGQGITYPDFLETLTKSMIISNNITWLIIMRVPDRNSSSYTKKIK